MIFRKLGYYIVINIYKDIDVDVFRLVNVGL